MGVHNLLPFLKKHAPTAFQSFSSWKQGRTVKLAVDTPIFMYKFAYAVGTGPLLCDRMMRFVSELRAEGIEPTFVFDGAALSEKSEESLKRRAKQEGSGCVTLACSDGMLEMEVDGRTPLVTQPTSRDYQIFREACGAAGVPTATARYEAEALCAHLCATRDVDGVLTEDSDALAYGCSSVVLKWGHGAEVANAHEAARALSFSPTQFQEACVLMGNDFNARLRGTGPARACAYMRACGNLEGVLAKLSCSPREAERMRRAARIFASCCSEAVK